MTHVNLWYEIYRPQTLDDIRLSDRKKTALKEWFDKFHNGDNKQCAILFMGPPGLGKTSLAHIILKHYGYQVKEFNASDIRSKSLITENLDGLVNMINVKGDGKVAIIMDEVDGMFKGDRGGVDALLSFISMPSKRRRKDQVNHNRNVPIICISNVANVKKEIINNLKKECFTIDFTVPTKADMMAVLDKVASSEGMTITDSAKDRIIDYAQADFRRLVNLLEFVSGSGVVDDDRLTSCFTVMTLKEQDMYVTEAVKKLINQQLDPWQIQSIYNSDKSKTPMVIHQNYLSAMSGQKQPTSEKLADALSIIDSLITSDVVEKMMYNTQNWGLQNVQSVTCAHIPSYYINKRPKQYIVEARWAEILSVNSQAYNLWKNVNIELIQMSRHKSYNVTNLQHVIEVVLHRVMRGGPDDIDLAMKTLANYGLCQDLSVNNKKALSTIDKLGKYIKISPYYGRWAKFLVKNKSNRELEAAIYKAYIKYDKSIENIRPTAGLGKSGPSGPGGPGGPGLPVKQIKKFKPVAPVPQAKSETEQKDQVQRRKVTVVIKKDKVKVS